MKYLCLVYLEGEKLHAVPDSECVTCGEGFRKSGLLIAAEALQPVETATTVRVRHGTVSVTDGPFAETKEQLAGYYLTSSNAPNRNGLASLIEHSSTTQGPSMAGRAGKAYNATYYRRRGGR